MYLDVDQLIRDFVEVAKLTGIELRLDDVEVERLSPHLQPTRLPTGKMAVYVFSMADLCLKVGKVGPNSHARFTSQHYNPASSNSNLAKSLLGCDNWDFCPEPNPPLEISSVGSWIKQYTERYNFYFDASRGRELLSLFEAYLQCKLHPRFEG